MKAKTKSALLTILWMFVFFFFTGVAYVIFGSLVRHRTDLPKWWGWFAGLLPFAPLIMAVLAFFMGRSGWLPGTESDDDTTA